MAKSLGKCGQASGQRRKQEDVPIVAITNGVHLLTWMDPIWLQPLLDRYLGPIWVRDQDRAGIWELVKKIPDAELWRLRRRLKGLLIDEINERARDRWQNKRVHAESVIAFGALLEPEVFTIGFARRFTGYKRPDLFCTTSIDSSAFSPILCVPYRLFSPGKAHPSDVEGARIIQRIFRLAAGSRSRRAHRLCGRLRPASGAANGARRRCLAE